MAAASAPVHEVMGSFARRHKKFLILTGNCSSKPKGLTCVQSSLVFLPPYSPELNLDEGLWKWLKADVINNVFYHTTSQIRENVEAFMDRIMRNPLKIIDRLCLSM